MTRSAIAATLRYTTTPGAPVPDVGEEDPSWTSVALAMEGGTYTAALRRVPELDLVLGPARVGELRSLLPGLLAGERIVAVGLKARRTTTASPFVMPPCTPPERLLDVRGRPSGPGT